MPAPASIWRRRGFSATENCRSRYEHSLTKSANCRAAAFITQEPWTARPGRSTVRAEDTGLVLRSSPQLTPYFGSRALVRCVRVGNIGWEFFDHFRLPNGHRAHFSLPPPHSFFLLCPAARSPYRCLHPAASRDTCTAQYAVVRSTQ